MEIKCNSAADDESVTTTEKYDTETTPQSRTERTILEKRTTGTVFALKTSIRDATTAVPESMTDIDSSKDKVAQPIQNEEKGNDNIYRLIRVTAKLTNTYSIHSQIKSKINLAK